MERYHMRRKDKVIEDPSEMKRILKSQKHVTLALCKDGEPYLVTMNHVYDEAESCLYFHCAQRGKKLDFLRANPRVWGQALEDLGYMDGKCDHAYHTVQFEGTAEFVTDFDEKWRALELMIHQLETDPEPVKARAMDQKKVEAVGVLRVRITGMSGKRAPKPDKKPL